MAWSVMLISLSRLSYNFPFHLLVSVKGPRIECSETPYVCTVSSLCYLSLNGWAGLDFISYFAVISLKQKGHASYLVPHDLSWASIGLRYMEYNP